MIGSDRPGKQSLKQKLMAVLITETVLIMIAVGGISYYSIIYMHIHDVKKDVNQSIQNLSYQLKTVYDELSNSLRLYVAEDTITENVPVIYDFSDKDLAHNQEAVIRTNMACKALTLYATNFIQINSNITGIALYFPENAGKQEYHFAPRGDLQGNYLKDDFTLFHKDGITFQGIHQSAMFHSMVISANRRIVLGDRVIDVYMEMQRGNLQTMLDNSRFSDNAKMAVVSGNGVVIYSEVPEIFPAGEQYNEESQVISPSGDKWLIYKGEGENFSIIEFIPERNISLSMSYWYFRFSFILLLCAATVVITFLYIWKQVLLPIKIFHFEFQRLSESPLHQLTDTPNEYTGLLEYDNLIDEYRKARVANYQLQKTIEDEIRREKELELEKLMVQINPHFIYNTLNSVQWIARAHKEKEIEKILTLFIRIIHFNLSQKNQLIPLGDELSELSDYIELQKIKKICEFEVDINVDTDLRNRKVPRFVLQPLVENAIYHGFAGRDASKLSMYSEIADADHFVLLLDDNGCGMEGDKIEQILMGEYSDDGRHGIGLSYVIERLRFYCDVDEPLRISSVPGHGTTISIVLPLREELYTNPD